MKFLEEKQLRDSFWEKYKYRKSIIQYQFENQVRHGGTDLITVESVKCFDKADMIQFCAFEFKLNDIKKVLAQAERNLEYFHKSFIVIPADKEKIILERYSSWINEKKYIGVIGMEYEGNWKMIIQPKTQSDSQLKISQEILKVVANVL